MQVFKISNSTCSRLQIGPNGGCLLSSSMMACLFILVFSRSFAVFSTEKTLLQSEYFTKISIRALSNSRAPTWAYFPECTGIFSCFQMAIYTTNILLLTSNATIINSFELTIWTCLVVDRTSLVVQVLHINIFLLNDMFALLIFKKSIPRITSNLILATKKVL